MKSFLVPGPEMMMLLQSRLDDHTNLFIDTTVAGGFAKGDEDLGFHPDKILDNVVEVAALVARHLAEAATAAAATSTAPPARLKLAFGIKIDGASVVSVASDMSRAHFQVTAEWEPG